VNTTENPKTVQLRRYTIHEGELENFVAWWAERMPRVRAAHGFTVEFAYALPSTNEFVWAVSAPGDVAAFTEREKTYFASDLRRAAVDGIPQRVVSERIDYAEDVSVASA